MSLLFKLVDPSFLLTLGIILLVCGSVMLYSYRRLNILERSVIEHGKILQNFIINYNIQMQTINTMCFNKTHPHVEQIKKINLGDKICVSEDETSENEYVLTTNSIKQNISDIDDEDEDEDDDGDEDEDDDGDEDEDDGDEDDDDEDEDDDDEDDDDDDDEDAEDDVLTLTKKELEKSIKDLGDFEEIDLSKQFFSNNDDETFIKNLPINLDTFNIDLNNNSKIINLNANDNAIDNAIDNGNDDNMDNINTNSASTINNKKNYSKMKVDDLKTIAVTRNLIDNETAQKTKKADLIKILQNA